MNFLLFQLITATCVVVAIFVFLCYQDLKKDREDHNELFKDNDEIHF